jgi:hypothetical protein
MSALLSPRRGSSLASISSPCLRVKTPAKFKQPSLESPSSQQDSSPRTPASSSKLGQQLYSGTASARPPITPFKDEYDASDRPADESRQKPGAASNGPRRWTLDDFEIGKPLGRGKFGNVYAAKEKGSGVVVALKVMSKSPMLAEGAEKQLQREVAIHSRVVHPHILRMAGYFHNPKSCFIILGKAREWPSSHQYKLAFEGMFTAQHHPLTDLISQLCAVSRVRDRGRTLRRTAPAPRTCPRGAARGGLPGTAPARGWAFEPLRRHSQARLFE